MAKKPNNYWTDERLIEEAKKYNSKSEFSKNNESAYRISLKRNLLNDLFVNKLKSWDKDSVIKEAKKYNSRSEFFEKSKSAYRASTRLGLLEELFDIKYHYWTIEEVIEESKKYDTKMNFKNNCNTAYNISCKNNLIDILFPNLTNYTKYKQELHIVYKYILFSEIENKYYVYIGITHDEKTRIYNHTKDNSRYSSVKEKLKEGLEIKSYDVLYRDISWNEADIIETKLIGNYLNDVNYTLINIRLKGNKKKSNN